MVSASLAKDQLDAWGWRIPFVVGLLWVPAGLYLRRVMWENPHAQRVVALQCRGALLKQNAGLIALSVSVVLGSTVSTYVTLYMITYALTTLHMAATGSVAATDAQVYGDCLKGCK